MNEWNFIHENFHRKQRFLPTLDTPLSLQTLDTPPPPNSMHTLDTPTPPPPP